MYKLHKHVQTNIRSIVKNCNVLSKDITVACEKMVIIYRQQEIAI